jgi:hypothetical protein
LLHLALTPALALGSILRNMKLIAIPLIAFVVTVIGLLGFMIIFHAITEPNYAPCATDKDAIREWANTGRIRQNNAGQYLCPVRSDIK